MNFTVTSAGVQFDRLALMWLGDVEVWRTSTAEPKANPGIIWTYWKEMTPYLSLWKQPQTLIFDLGNIQNDKYTGSFNTTLTATFIDDDEDVTDIAGAPPADKIIAVSKHQGSLGSGSAFTYPADKAQNNLTLPRNIKRAVFSISANGQSDEEFWWSNVPDEDTNVFNGTTLFGKGAFREVKLRIDGQIAGYSWPFPVIFTGGVSPALHRPISGTQSFDLREQEIDITPWLGVLCDGKQHNFSLEVTGQNDAVVNNYWIMSGKIFLWLDEDSESITRGCAPKVLVSKNNFVPNDEAVPNKSLKYDQRASRSIEVRTKLKRNGQVVRASWSQKFIMSNRGQVTDGGNNQDVDGKYSGQDEAVYNTSTVYFNKYNYPVRMNYKETPKDTIYAVTSDANLTQGMDISIQGQSTFSNGLEPFVDVFSSKKSVGSDTTTTRESRAYYYRYLNGTSGGFGRTHQVYKFGGRGSSDATSATTTTFQPQPVLYSRDVTVVNNTITQDKQYIYGQEESASLPATPRPVQLGSAEGQFAPLKSTGDVEANLGGK